MEGTMHRDKIKKAILIGALASIAVFAGIYFYLNRPKADVTPAISIFSPIGVTSTHLQNAGIGGKISGLPDTNEDAWIDISYPPDSDPANFPPLVVAEVLVNKDSDNNNEPDPGDPIAQLTLGDNENYGNYAQFSLNFNLDLDTQNNFVVVVKVDGAVFATADIPTITQVSFNPPIITQPTENEEITDTTPEFRINFNNNGFVHQATQWNLNVMLDNDNPNTIGDLNWGGWNTSDKTSITVPVALGAGNYRLRVRVKDGQGVESPESVRNFKIAATTPPPELTVSPPTSVTVSAGNEEIDLHWTNPTGGNFDGIAIYRSTTQFSTSQTAHLTSVIPGQSTPTNPDTTGQSYIDGQVEPNTTYYYTLKAYATNTDTAIVIYSSGVEILATTAQTVNNVSILLPDQVFTTGTGVEGDETSFVAGQEYTIKIVASDSNNNIVSNATNLVTITSSDPNAILPEPANLVAGEKEFKMTLKRAGQTDLTVEVAGAEQRWKTIRVDIDPNSVSGATSSLVAMDFGNTISTTYTLIAYVKDEFSNFIEEETVTLSSSRSSDYIEQPRISDSGGAAVGSISASELGDSTITAKVGDLIIGAVNLSFYNWHDNPSHSDTGSDSGTGDDSGTGSGSSSSGTGSDSNNNAGSDSGNSTGSGSSGSSSSSSDSSGSVSNSTNAPAGSSAPASTGEGQTTNQTAPTGDTQSPVAVINAPSFAYMNQAVEIKGSSSTDNVGVTSFQWTLPDGSSRTESDFSYTPTSAGSLSFTLAVKDVAGNQSITTHNLIVAYPNPTIQSIVQEENDVVIIGQTESDATVIVYVYSDPKSFTTRADSDGNFRLAIPIRKIGDGNHRFVSIALPKDLATDANIAMIDEDAISKAISKLESGSIEGQTDQGKQIIDNIEINGLTVTPGSAQASQTSYIIYLIVGAVLILIIIGLSIMFYLRNKKDKSDNEYDTGDVQSDIQPNQESDYSTDDSDEEGMSPESELEVDEDNNIEENLSESDKNDKIK